MKVLHVITGLAGGGAEATLLRLLEHSAVGSVVVVSLTSQGIHGRALVEKGIVVHALGMERTGIPSAESLRHLVWLMRKYRPQIVQTWMYHADLLGGVCARIAGVDRIIWNLRSEFPRYPLQKFSTVLLAFLLALFSWVLPDEVVACGHRSKASHVRFGYCGRKIKVIHNGYPSGFPGKQNPTLQKRSLSARWGKLPVVLQIANYSPIKGHSILIEAVGRLAREGLFVQLWMVGRDVHSDNGLLLSKIIEQGLSNRTELFGYQEDVNRFFDGADLLVSPSLSEGFPNVVAEATLAGLPCVVSDVGESAMVVGDPDFVFTPGNPEDLANKLRRAIYGMNDETQNKARVAKERAQELFSLDKMVDSYDKLYQ